MLNSNDTHQDCSRSKVSKWIVILLKLSVLETNYLSKYPNRSHPDYLCYSDIFESGRLPITTTKKSIHRVKINDFKLKVFNNTEDNASV